MIVENLSTNTVVLLFEEINEGITTTITDWNFFLAPGAKFEFGYPFSGPPYETQVAFAFAGHEDTYNSEQYFEGRLVIVGNDLGQPPQGYPIPAPLNSDTGVYLATRFSLVILALLLGVALARVYQEARKGGK